MKFFVRWCTSFLLSFVVAHPPAYALSLLTEEWGPITFSSNGTAQGFGVEVVEAIQARLKTNNPISVIPWPRGYYEAKTQRNTVLFTVVRSKEREKMFTLLGPLVSCEISFYGLANKDIKIENLEDAKRLGKIAAKQDTLFASTLENAGFANLFLTKNPQQEAHLLAAGRVDLISNDAFIIKEAFRKIGKGDVKIKKYFTVKKGELYIAFSKGTARETIEQWRKALEEIKDDGTFAEIVRKWLPQSHVLSNVQLVGYGTRL